MRKRHIQDSILEYVRECARAAAAASPAEITARVGGSRPTINRYLVRLVRDGQLRREGSGPATVYRLPDWADWGGTFGTPWNLAVAEPPLIPRELAGPAWTPAARALRADVTRPLLARTPVSYRRDFVETYHPNGTSLLPPALADSLFQSGRAEGRLPAGTYARKVLEQLLIDLSWHSSRLEGNPMSLLDTRELFALGRSPVNDPNATMLLNHKDAIEFLVDVVPEHGITVPVIRNFHSILMQGLLSDPTAVGAIRRKVVTIGDSVYLPSQVPSFLEEMLTRLVNKARLIKNPIEASFFLWINIAYLQPFEDGNKRTSRLSANLPLLLSNCAPLSFLDVNSSDYALAMIGVYEQRDVRIAAELFEWTYQRSIAKYKAVQDALGAPDPLRAAYREQLGEAVRRTVGGESLSSVVGSLGLPKNDRKAFKAMAQEELRHLEPYNCGRYRLSIQNVERWIRKRRPGL